MRLFLYLSMLPDESFLVLKTYFHLMVVTPLGKSKRSLTSLLFIEFISSFMTLYHNSDSLELMTYEKDQYHIQLQCQILVH